MKFWGNGIVWDKETNKALKDSTGNVIQFPPVDVVESEVKVFKVKKPQKVAVQEKDGTVYKVVTQDAEVRKTALNIDDTVTCKKLIALGYDHEGELPKKKVETKK